MALPASISVQSYRRPDITRRKKRYYYAIFLADPGTPTYQTGGIPVDLTTVTNPRGYERAKWASPALPNNDDIEQITTPLGYVLALQQAASLPTMKNFVLHIFTAPGTELGNGSNIPAALFGATLAAAPEIMFEIRGADFN